MVFNRVQDIDFYFQNGFELIQPQGAGFLAYAVKEITAVLLKELTSEEYFHCMLLGITVEM